MSNSIELMLGALKAVQGNINPERGFADELEAEVGKAIAAGEAELKREPVAWVREDKSGNEGPSAVFEAPSKHMITYAAKCGEKYGPVWDRKEIK